MRVDVPRVPLANLPPEERPHGARTTDRSSRKSSPPVTARSSLATTPRLSVAGAPPPVTSSHEPPPPPQTAPAAPHASDPAPVRRRPSAPASQKSRRAVAVASNPLTVPEIHERAHLSLPRRGYVPPPPAEAAPEDELGPKYTVQLFGVHEGRFGVLKSVYDLPATSASAQRAWAVGSGDHEPEQARSDAGACTPDEPGLAYHPSADAEVAPAPGAPPAADPDEARLAHEVHSNDRWAGRALATCGPDPRRPRRGRKARGGPGGANGQLPQLPHAPFRGQKLGARPKASIKLLRKSQREKRRQTATPLQQKRQQEQQQRARRWMAGLDDSQLQELLKEANEGNEGVDEVYLHYVRLKRDIESSRGPMLPPPRQMSLQAFDTPMSSPEH